MAAARPDRRQRRRDQLSALDLAAYTAIADTASPDLDLDFARLSRAADHSKLWIATAVLLATTGPRGRRAAVNGLAGVALASATTNLIAKPLGGRRRPDRDRHRLAAARAVRMPTSTSFPSGHAASAAAFASGVSNTLPAAGPALQLMAGAVAYSRIHTGVHYPGDVLVGALIGYAVAPVAEALVRGATLRPRSEPARLLQRLRR